MTVTWTRAGAGERRALWNVTEAAEAAGVSVTLRPATLAGLLRALDDALARESAHGFLIEDVADLFDPLRLTGDCPGCQPVTLTGGAEAHRPGCRWSEVRAVAEARRRARQEGAQA